MKYIIPYALKLVTELPSSMDRYTFVDGNPVDIRNRKYGIFKMWHRKNMLYCFSCHTPASHFRLVKCEREGCFHPRTGRRKHVFHLYTNDETKFTLDHWYPRWFLKQNDFLDSKTNMVPMCQKCNNDKADSLPIAGRYNKTFYVPYLKFKNKENEVYDHWKH
jgi:hypothetical protein